MLHIRNLAWLFWDPPRKAFTIPFLDRPVMWYGIFFVTGFILGYFIILPMFRSLLYQGRLVLMRDVADWKLLSQSSKKDIVERTKMGLLLSKHLNKNTRDQLEAFPKNEPSLEQKNNILQSLSLIIDDPTSNVDRKTLEKLYPGAIAKVGDLSIVYADRITWFIVIGTVIGARLGHILFYDLGYYLNRPGEIFKIWEGGLASHGGTIGVLLSIFLFLRWHRTQLPQLSFVSLIDIVVVPTALVAFFIRIGNLFNQEIIGYPSTVPWAIIFGHPADGAAPVPRHPTQLYEAIAYLAAFFILYFLWKFRAASQKVGLLSGLFFIFIFGSRFLIEFFKLPQSNFIDESFLQMGQLLSVPFILIGVLLLLLPGRYLHGLSNRPAI